MTMCEIGWKPCIWAPSISVQSNWIQLLKKNVLGLAFYICGPYLLACSQKKFTLFPSCSSFQIQCFTKVWKLIWRVLKRYMMVDIMCKILQDYSDSASEEL